MYVNSEIVKRKGAIGVEVSPCFIGYSLHAKDVLDLVLRCIADAPPPNWVKIEVPLLCCLSPHIDARPERAAKSRYARDTRHTTRLSRPPSAAHFNHSQPEYLLAIQPPSESNTPLPFIASTFSHACPTRAPGDHSRMYFVLSTFFRGPVSSEERRIETRLASMRFFSLPNTP